MSCYVMLSLAITMFCELTFKYIHRASMNPSESLHRPPRATTIDLAEYAQPGQRVAWQLPGSPKRWRT